MCACREKASLLFHGSEPWELRWGGAVKDTTPLPGFPPGVLVSFHPTPLSAASPCLSAPDAPRHLPISLSFRNVTGRTGLLLSRPGSCSWDRLQGVRCGLECDQIWEEEGDNHQPSPPPFTRPHTSATHTKTYAQMLIDPGKAGGETSASPSFPAAFFPKTLDSAEHLVPSCLREPGAPAALCC